MWAEQFVGHIQALLGKEVRWCLCRKPVPHPRAGSGDLGVGSAVPGLAALRALDNPTQMHVCELTVSRASRFGRGL